MVCPARPSGAVPHDLVALALAGVPGHQRAGRTPHPARAVLHAAHRRADRGAGRRCGGAGLGPSVDGPGRRPGAAPAGAGAGWTAPRPRRCASGCAPAGGCRSRGPRSGTPSCSRWRCGRWTCSSSRSWSSLPVVLLLAPWLSTVDRMSVFGWDVDPGAEAWAASALGVLALVGAAYLLTIAAVAQACARPAAARPARGRARVRPSPTCAGPGWTCSTRSRRSGAGSSGTCTTAPSSIWCCWR